MKYEIALIVGFILVLIGLVYLVSSSPNATNSTSEMMLGDNWDCGLISYPTNVTKTLEIMKYCTGGEKETP